MSSPPADLDPQLVKISSLGFPFAIRNDYIVVSISYLDKNLELRRGFLADPLNRPDGVSIQKPNSHQIYFIGDEPFSLQGTSLVPWLGGGENRTLIFGQNYSSYFFSHKKQEGGQNVDYPDLYSKIKQHVEFISGPASYKFENAGPAFLNVDFGDDLESPFLYPDTHSSHNELNDLNNPFRDMTIGIIGVGGTGSYILDFIAKMPVHQIVLIDDDEFSVKNSYRSPGSVNYEDFGKAKTEFFRERYATFRRGVISRKGRLTELSADLISDVNFAFLCVDNGQSRREATKVLLDHGVPFIDSGLGLARQRGTLEGMIRTTIVDERSRETVAGQRTLPMQADKEELYQTNIQISELNALNAAVSVIAFKKLFGFYAEDDPFFNWILKIGSFSTARQMRT